MGNTIVHLGDFFLEFYWSVVWCSTVVLKCLNNCLMLGVSLLEVLHGYGCMLTLLSRHGNIRPYKFLKVQYIIIGHLLNLHLKDEGQHIIRVTANSC